MAKVTKKTIERTEKKSGARWATKTLRELVSEQVNSGVKSTEDVARLEFEIAKFEQRCETNRLLAKIARQLKRRNKR